MGSIDKYIFRTTLASLALIALAIGESNARLPRLLGWPVTA
jgi:hypothetical protein